MFCAEHFIKLSTSEVIPYKNIITLDCSVNKLYIHKNQQKIPLSQAQKRLFFCLLSGVNRKRDIINLIWHENHQCIVDNNYHQLLFQTRALLQRYNLPGQLIMTIPNFGLTLNEDLLKELMAPQNNIMPEALQERVPPPLWLRFVHYSCQLFRFAFLTGGKK